MVIENRRAVMEKLLELPACTLITTGRTGTDFLQSLFDSHPEVLTFNGHLFFHAFWKSSICVGAGGFEPNDLLDEFIGKNIEKFKSKYDVGENKHRLGDGFDQSLALDLDLFKREALGLLDGQPLNPRTVLTAIYGAYAICLGQDIDTKRLFFHHTHHFDEADAYLRDYPESKIICMTRDPRANFVSSVEHHRTYNALHGIDTDQGSNLLFYIDRILKDSTPLRKYSNDYRVVKLEDLGNEEIIESLRNWLGVSDDPCLTRSTWGGLRWHGDKLSTKKDDSVGFSKTILENGWEQRLTAVDKYVLNYIMSPRLARYGYKHRKVGVLDALIAPFLIVIPLSYERRFLTPGYVSRAIRKRQFKKLARNVFSYAKRVSLFMKFYLRVTKRTKYDEPLLTAETHAR